MSNIDNTITYEAAVAEDIDGICELLHVMHAENGIGGLNPVKTLQAVADVIDAGVVLIALDGERIVGSVGLQHGTWWYSDDLYVGDLWTFVHPEYRRSKIAPRLVKRAREYARGLGLPLLMAVLTPHQPERAEKLLLRQMQPIGRTFMEARV